VTYPDAIQFLYDLRLFGLKLGLENTFKLAALAGNPQNKLRFIHVAGTNGKGSTCAMLESIYRAAGLRVGLFTSPHLVSFRERIQVNRALIAEADVVRLAGELQRLIGHFDTARHATIQPARSAGIPRLPSGGSKSPSTVAPDALEVIARTAREKNATMTVVTWPKSTPHPSQEGNKISRADGGRFPSAGGEPTVGALGAVPLLGGVRGGLLDDIALPLLGDH